MNNVIIAQDSPHFTGSGIITEHPAVCSGFLLGTDSTNDPTIGLWGKDGGKLIIPTCPYDASALGLNGASTEWRYSKEGLSLNITCAGTVYVVPLWQSWIEGLPRDVR